jgi:hypothetical protein
MSPQTTKTQPANVAADQNLEQEIRSRAYALYEERGRGDGRDLDDWLRAEMEITAAVRKAA